MKKKILITGGAGFIGSNLVHWLLDNTEHVIYLMDNFSGGSNANIPPNDRVMPCTKISDTFLGRLRHNVIDVAKDNVNEIFGEIKPDICYHLAAYAAEGRSNYIRRFNHYNNTLGTANIINACVNHNCKLIFTSSVAVYSGKPPFNEETLPNPIDEYGVSKYCSELSIQIAGEQQGLDWCIVRPRNVYGERQSIFDPARNVMGIWMYQILNNQPMTIFGDGSNKRTFTYVQDIMGPLYKAIDVSKEIINLGSERAYSIARANEILQAVTGYNNVQYLEPRHEVSEAICDTDKSKRLLGFGKETDLLTGLTNMWNWAKSIPMRPRTEPPPLEITKGIHESLKSVA